MVALQLSRRFQALTAMLLLLMVTYVTLVKQQSAVVETLQYRHNILDNIANRTLGFQKIFVINLPGRTDLRDIVALAAHFSELDVEIVDGVSGADISSKALPPGAEKAHINIGGLGNWRAHMNVARTIVEQNIQSALVLESDADWDIRIKSQMRQFAEASRLLLQPLKNSRSLRGQSSATGGSNDDFLDPTYPLPRSDEDVPSSFIIRPDDDQNPTSMPRTSPYGDLERWDLFWLGHCGCRFPRASDMNVPLGRAVIHNDATVPEFQHLNMELGDMGLLDQYPPHTRVISRARVNSCTLGHAFSISGARKFLYEFGIRRLDAPTDMLFQSLCDGVNGRPLAVCLTVQPQLFQHHRPRGPVAKQSDIDEEAMQSIGFNEHGSTLNVRWSVRENLQRLLDGKVSLKGPNAITGPDVEGDNGWLDLWQDGAAGASYHDDEISG